MQQQHPGRPNGLQGPGGGSASGDKPRSLPGSEYLSQGDEDSCWSATALHCLRPQVLADINEWFKAYSRNEKLQCLLSFFHAQPTHLAKSRHVMQSIIEQAVLESDEWVRALGRLLIGFPATGAVQCCQVDSELVYRLTEVVRVRGEQHRGLLLPRYVEIMGTVDRPPPAVAPDPEAQAAAARTSRRPSSVLDFIEKQAKELAAVVGIDEEEQTPAQRAKAIKEGLAPQIGGRKGTLPDAGPGGSSAGVLLNTLQARSAPLLPRGPPLATVPEASDESPRPSGSASPASSPPGRQQRQKVTMPPPPPPSGSASVQSQSPSSTPRVVPAGKVATAQSRTSSPTSGAGLDWDLEGLDEAEQAGVVPAGSSQASAGGGAPGPGADVVASLFGDEEADVVPAGSSQASAGGRAPGPGADVVASLFGDEDDSPNPASDLFSDDDGPLIAAAAAGAGATASSAAAASQGIPTGSATMQGAAAEGSSPATPPGPPPRASSPQPTFANAVVRSAAEASSPSSGTTPSSISVGTTDDSSPPSSSQGARAPPPAKRPRTDGGGA